MSLFGDKSQKIERWGRKGKRKKLIEIMNNGETKYRAEAAKAMGNINHMDVVNVLVSSLRDPDATVRANVLDSLGKLKAKTAEEHVRRLIDIETDPVVKEKAQAALNAIRDSLG